jgi:hypothetical protein
VIRSPTDAFGGTRARIPPHAFAYLYLAGAGREHQICRYYMPSRMPSKIALLRQPLAPRKPASSHPSSRPTAAMLAWLTGALAFNAPTTRAFATFGNAQTKQLIRIWQPQPLDNVPNGDVLLPAAKRNMQTFVRARILLEGAGRQCTNAMRRPYPRLVLPLVTRVSSSFDRPITRLHRLLRRLAVSHHLPIQQSRAPVAVATVAAIELNSRSSRPCLRGPAQVARRMLRERAGRSSALWSPPRVGPASLGRQHQPVVRRTPTPHRRDVETSLRATACRFAVDLWRARARRDRVHAACFRPVWRLFCGCSPPLVIATSRARGYALRMLRRAMLAVSAGLQRPCRVFLVCTVFSIWCAACGVRASGPCVIRARAVRSLRCIVETMRCACTVVCTAGDLSSLLTPFPP